MSTYNTFTVNELPFKKASWTGNTVYMAEMPVPGLLRVTIHDGKRITTFDRPVKDYISAGNKIAVDWCTQKVWVIKAPENITNPIYKVLAIHQLPKNEYFLTVGGGAEFKTDLRVAGSYPLTSHSTFDGTRVAYKSATVQVETRHEGNRVRINRVWVKDSRPDTAKELHKALQESRGVTLGDVLF